ncbi:hypothetical protein ABXV18_24845 [Vibrio owensii]|uniref:hypothetical protein n=1 Tax=Vibrio owensii TaxID=696485 RepID=UPI003393B73C
MSGSLAPLFIEMHKDDIEYGKVLVTGEIAFYMQHPKGRLITPKAKTEFLKKWISRRIKKKTDNSAVRRYLKEVRSSKFLNLNWDKALDHYTDYVSCCKAYRKLGMTDRKLMNCAMEQLKVEGFIVKENVELGEEFSPEEAKIDRDRGSFIMMREVNELFDGERVPDGTFLKILVTSKELTIRATQVLEKFCFPIQYTSRNEILALRSAEQQIDMVLKMVDA